MIPRIIHLYARNSGRHIQLYETPVPASHLQTLVDDTVASRNIRAVAPVMHPGEEIDISFIPSSGR